ncbi:hypothetical protein PanWU01x14_275000, partial [Parasponia andersonii]
ERQKKHPTHNATAYYGKVLLMSLKAIVFQYHIKDGVKVQLPSQKMESKNEKEDNNKEDKSFSCLLITSNGYFNYFKSSKVHMPPTNPCNLATVPIPHSP